MKKLLFAIIFISFFVTVNAQFKEDPNNDLNIRSGILNTSTSNIFGFFDPSKFSMHHSLEMSYTTFAGGGIALGVYTNSMRYDFTNNFNIQVDASIVNSPYSTFGNNSNFANSINGIYLSRAALNYKPSKNTFISIEFRQMPGGFYNNYNSNYFMSPSFNRQFQGNPFNEDSK